MINTMAAGATEKVRVHRAASLDYSVATDRIDGVRLHDGTAIAAAYRMLMTPEAPLPTGAGSL